VQPLHQQLYLNVLQAKLKPDTIIEAPNSFKATRETLSGTPTWLACHMLKLLVEGLVVKRQATNTI